MSLIDIEIAPDESVLPDHVVAFLHEADSRITQFGQGGPTRATGFVPSDFVTVYRALKAIADANLAPGNSLCEWGSGFGVVASLAAMLEYSACGIEIERDLVDASRKLADDSGLAVEFVHGSFIPSGAEAFAEESFADTNSEYSWLVTDADDGYDELGLGPEDFDIIFAYPWPGEEYLMLSLFEEYAAEGALFLMYDQFNSVRLLGNVGATSVGR